MNNKKRKDRVTGIIIAISLTGIFFFGLLVVTGRMNDSRRRTPQYDMERFRQYDPDLLHYTEIKTIPLFLRESYGLAVDRNNRIYVTGDNQVIIMNTEGQIESMFKTDVTALCIDVDSDGNIYLGMNSHIEVFDNIGTQKTSWGVPEGAMFASISIVDDYIYATDARNRVLRKYDKNGNEILKIGERDPERNIPGSIVPGSFFGSAAGQGDSIWLVNPGRHSLENYTPEGDLLSSWGGYSMETAGFSGCCNPTHIAVLPDGKIVTSEKGIPRVKVYSSNGELESVVAGPEMFSESTEGLDLAIDANGRIYVLDPEKRAVRIFEKKGR